MRSSEQFYFENKIDLCLGHGVSWIICYLVLADRDAMSNVDTLQHRVKTNWLLHKRLSTECMGSYKPIYTPLNSDQAFYNQVERSWGSTFNKKHSQSLPGLIRYKGNGKLGA